MASLIIGGTILLTEKIKAKKEAKRQAKADVYEKRYKELEDEHQKKQRSPTNNLEKVHTGQTQTTNRSSEDGRRTSHESERNEKIDDGPSQWVNEVYTQRTGSRTGTQ